MEMYVIDFCDISVLSSYDHNFLVQQQQRLRQQQYQQ
jgi:hypothetical protein